MGRTYRGWERKDLMGLLFLKEIRDLSFLRSVIQTIIMWDYGIQETGQNAWPLKKRLRRRLFYASLRHEIRDALREHLRISGLIGMDYQDTIEKKLDVVSDQEIFKCARFISKRAEKYNHQLFYESAIAAYRKALLVHDGFANAVNQLTSLRPSLELRVNEGFIPFKKLRFFLGAANAEQILNNLPYDHAQAMRCNGCVTIESIQELNESLRSFDIERDRLHNMIVNYAKKHLGKDRLDVGMDILFNDDAIIYVGGPDNNRLVFSIGALFTDSLRYEFVREYGKSTRLYDRDEIDKDCAQKLDAERTKMSEIKHKIEYKSFFGERRTEEQDNSVLEDMKARYPEYVHEIIDYGTSSMHRHLVLTKMIVFDLDKIKNMNPDPQQKLEEIKRYFLSCFPKTE